MLILVLFDILQLTRYSSRQKAGVSGNKRENTSRRPANIKKEFIHNVVSFSTPHEPSGPIKWPILGPTLLKEEIANPNESSKDNPIATITKVDNMMSMKYITKNTNTVRAVCEVIVVLLMRTGRTACG